jgi:hypothetical protein
MLYDIVSSTYMGSGRGRENRAICPPHYVFTNQNSEEKKWVLPNINDEN